MGRQSQNLTRRSVLCVPESEPPTSRGQINSTGRKTALAAVDDFDWLTNHSSHGRSLCSNGTIIEQ